jgi:hypothetical protein
MTLKPLYAQSLTANNIRHGFFGRAGGVSQGIYASLNCGPGSEDAADAVAENRKRGLQALSENGKVKLLTLNQSHSAEAVTVRDPPAANERPRADGAVTDRPHIALGILTADCAPVLFADADARVIGAAHVGWKGAIGGIIDNVVVAMMRLSAKTARIRAAIGPCISQAAYEVGPEFIARFREVDSQNARFFTPSDHADHWQFDLPAYIAHRLAHAGVSNVEPLSACTYARENDFFSYRRATHRREADYGRQLSAIMLTA